jgi:hypothetical protein
MYVFSHLLLIVVTSFMFVCCYYCNQYRFKLYSNFVLTQPSKLSIVINVCCEFNYLFVSACPGVQAGGHQYMYVGCAPPGTNTLINMMIMIIIIIITRFQSEE